MEINKSIQHINRGNLNTEAGIYFRNTKLKIIILNTKLFFLIQQLISKQIQSINFWKSIQISFRLIIPKKKIRTLSTMKRKISIKHLVDQSSQRLKNDSSSAREIINPTTHASNEITKNNNSQQQEKTKAKRQKFQAMQHQNQIFCQKVKDFTFLSQLCEQKP